MLKVQDLLKNYDKFTSVLKILDKGRIIIYPTETLYGIGCDPLGPNHPLERISEIKQRPKNKPLIFLIPDIRFLEEQGIPISHSARVLINRFWPGPLTLILPLPENSPLIDIAWKQTLAVRVSSHPFVRALFLHRRFPLASTSANLSGFPEDQARDPEIIRETFKNRIDLLITEGYKIPTPPSTLMDVTGEIPRIVREGAIALSEILPVIKTKKESV